MPDADSQSIDQDLERSNSDLEVDQSQDLDEIQKAQLDDMNSYFSKTRQGIYDRIYSKNARRRYY